MHGVRETEGRVCGVGWNPGDGAVPGVGAEVASTGAGSRGGGDVTGDCRFAFARSGGDLGRMRDSGPARGEGRALDGMGGASGGAVSRTGVGGASGGRAESGSGISGGTE